MSAQSVAARPGLATPRVPGAFAAVTLAIGLAIGLGAGVSMDLTQAAPGPGVVAQPEAPVTAAPLAAYQQVLASLRVAESRHDFAAQARFEAELAGLLTAETIGSVYLERSRLVSEFAAAKDQGDSRAAARSLHLMNALCGPAVVKQKLDFCN